MKISNYFNSHLDEYEKWIVNNEPGGIYFKILPYLSDIDKGVFVEAGAHDGVFQANTLILEREFGWSGILIEPSSELYKKCISNRNCIVENYALTSYNLENKDANISKGNINSAEISKSNLLNFNKFERDQINKIIDYLDIAINKNLFNNQELDLINHAKKTIKLNLENVIILMGDNDTSTCKTCTFDFLSKKHNIKKVDVFFLDVEGYELEVLKGINFDEVDISYFVIEINDLQNMKKEIDNFLFKKNYINIANISNFNSINCPTWPGTHQDFLYKKVK